MRTYVLCQRQNKAASCCPLFLLESIIRQLNRTFHFLPSGKYKDSRYKLNRPHMPNLSCSQDNKTDLKSYYYSPAQQSYQLVSSCLLEHPVKGHLYITRQNQTGELAGN